MRFDVSHVSLFLIVNVSEVVALVNVVVWHILHSGPCHKQSTLDSGGYLSEGGGGRQRRGHENIFLYI